MEGLTGVVIAVLLLACAAAEGDVPGYLRRCKLAEPVLRPTHRTGDFDSEMVDCPQVLRVGGKWLMQYTGFDGQKYRIGVAESDDLVHWTRAGVILDAGDESEWDYGSAGGGWLIEHEGWWYLFYCGFPLPGYEVGPGGTGLAKGRDIHRLEKGTEAVSETSPEIASVPFSRAPVLRPSPGDEWDSGGIYKAAVYRIDDRFVMFYNAKTKAEPWIEQTGLATSGDLIHWEKHPDNPILPVGPEGAGDSRFASDPVLNLIDGVWHLFYYGFDGQHAGDGVAISEDGGFTRWRKSEHNPILHHGPPGSYDSVHAHKPFVLQHEGVFYHYNCAVSETERTIALATSVPLTAHLQTGR